MTDHSRAVLIIELPDRTSKFVLRNSLGQEGNFTRDFLLGDRGGLINEVARRLDDDAGDARESFWLDGGSGSKSRTLIAQLVANTDGSEALQMGDGSSDPHNPDDTTQWDATGSHAISQAEVFDYTVAEARTDSQTPAELHVSEWSDGTEIEEGAFGRPLTVIIRETEWRFDADDSPSTVRYTVSMQSAASVEDVVDSLENDLR